MLVVHHVQGVPLAGQPDQGADEVAARSRRTPRRSAPARTAPAAAPGPRARRPASSARTPNAGRSTRPPRTGTRRRRRRRSRWRRAPAGRRAARRPGPGWPARSRWAAAAACSSASAASTAVYAAALSTTSGRVSTTAFSTAAGSADVQLGPGSARPSGGRLPASTRSRSAPSCPPAPVTRKRLTASTPSGGGRGRAGRRLSADSRSRPVACSSRSVSISARTSESGLGRAGCVGTLPGRGDTPTIVTDGVRSAGYRRSGFPRTRLPTCGRGATSGGRRSSPDQDPPAAGADRDEERKGR